MLSSVSVSGLASLMSALLPAHEHAACQSVRKHWGSDRIAVDILGARSHNVCVSPLDAAELPMEVLAVAFSLSENV